MAVSRLARRFSWISSVARSERASAPSGSVAAATRDLRLSSPASSWRRSMRASVSVIASREASSRRNSHSSWLRLPARKSPRPPSLLPPPRPSISRHTTTSGAVARLRGGLQPLVGRLQLLLRRPRAREQALALDQLLEALARRAAADEGDDAREAEQPEAGVDEARDAERGEQHLGERHRAEHARADRLPERGLHVVPVGQPLGGHASALLLRLASRPRGRRAPTSSTASLKAVVACAAIGSASRVFGIMSSNSRAMRPGPGRHDPDAVAQVDRLGDRVRHDHHRGLDLVPQLDDQPLHLVARRLVERRERLVHQDDLRLQHQRARDRDALLLAARELVRVLALVAAEARPCGSTRAPAPRARSARGAARPG